jgi:hypothetical protein
MEEETGNTDGGSQAHDPPCLTPGRCHLLTVPLP